MEQRMAKLALAQISQQKLRDADPAGGRKKVLPIFYPFFVHVYPLFFAKKVESEEKLRLRAERKRKEEEAKKKKEEEEERMREEAEMENLERERESEMEKERERLMGTFCQELLALSSEDGVRLLKERKLEVEDGFTCQNKDKDIAKELLKTLANLALEEREAIVKKEEEEAVKGESKRRVSFEEKSVEIEDQEGATLHVSNNERKAPGGGILKCQKTTVSKADVEKEAVKRWQNF